MFSLGCECDVTKIWYALRREVQGYAKKLRKPTNLLNREIFSCIRRLVELAMWALHASNKIYDYGYTILAPWHFYQGRNARFLQEIGMLSTKCVNPAATEITSAWRASRTSAGRGRARTSRPAPPGAWATRAASCATASATRCTTCATRGQSCCDHEKRDLGTRSSSSSLNLRSDQWQVIFVILRPWENSDIKIRSWLDKDQHGQFLLALVLARVSNWKGQLNKLQTAQRAKLWVSK